MLGKVFSIVIPSFNRQVELNDCLKKLTHQTFKAFEVIVIDDCSEKTVEIIDHMGLDIHLFRNIENQGAAQSRNIGVSKATTEWIVFLDDDDQFENDKLEVIYNIVNNNMDINFIYHPAKCHMVYQKFTYATHPETKVENITLESSLLANQIGGMPMIAIKKELFLSVGGLSTEIKALEDYEFLLKLIKSNSMRAYYLDKALTNCFFYTKRSSVSKNIPNTEDAINFIHQKYLDYSDSFIINANNMRAYAYLMNLSRVSAKYYWENFLLTRNITYAIKALLSFISPNFLIGLRRYIK